MGFFSIKVLLRACVLCPFPFFLFSFTISFSFFLFLSDSFMQLSVEEVLLRWLNVHAGRVLNRRVANFSSDLRDSEVYLALLQQVAPDACHLSLTDLRAEPDMVPFIFIFKKPFHEEEGGRGEEEGEEEDEKEEEEEEKRKKVPSIL
jgi:hypothetical protein